jgi:NADPH:quinone reductase-like Zn-dependent oxidoreductase
MLQIPWVTMTNSKRVIAGSAAEVPEDLRLLSRLASEGSLTPVIDRIYPLDQIVEAHRYVDAGHKRGNVVVTIGPEQTAADKHTQNISRN